MAKVTADRRRTGLESMSKTLGEILNTIMQIKQLKAEQAANEAVTRGMQSSSDPATQRANVLKNIADARANSESSGKGVLDSIFKKFNPNVPMFTGATKVEDLIAGRGIQGMFQDPLEKEYLQSRIDANKALANRRSGAGGASSIEFSRWQNIYIQSKALLKKAREEGDTAGMELYRGQMQFAEKQLNTMAGNQNNESPTLPSSPMPNAPFTPNQWLNTPRAQSRLDANNSGIEGPYPKAYTIPGTLPAVDYHLGERGIPVDAGNLPLIGGALKNMPNTGPVQNMVNGIPTVMGGASMPVMGPQLPQNFIPTVQGGARSTWAPDDTVAKAFEPYIAKLDDDTKSKLQQILAEGDPQKTKTALERLKEKYGNL